MKTILLFSAMMSIFSPTSFSKSKAQSIQRFSGTVESCHDGDTCRVVVNGKTMKVRFAGIDAPEIKQLEGSLSKDYLDSLVLNKNVELECEGKSFDRTTCTVFLGNENINQEMVKSGYAWDSPKYSKGIYRDLMIQAQEKRTGIWKTISISPYCFRHKNAKKCSGNPLWME